MKIAQVTAALPPFAPAAPRLAEGAMLFALPAIPGDNGSGDGAEALGDDATDPDQPAGNWVVANGATQIGSIVADGAMVRQIPSLPISPLAALARPQAWTPTVAPAAIFIAAESVISMLPPGGGAMVSVDSTVRPQQPETLPPQLAVPATTLDGSQPIDVGQTKGQSVGIAGEITEAARTAFAVERFRAQPVQTTSKTETVPVDARSGQLPPEPIPADRRSVGEMPPAAQVDALPTAILRQTGGDGAGHNGQERSSGEIRQIWSEGSRDVIVEAVPPEPMGVTVAPILSGMTRSADAITAPSLTAGLPLEVDTGGQWIDRLAVEISACSATGGVRLKLSPDNLGELSIAVSNGDSGASITITAQDEGVRSAIAGAQDRLMAEARAHGVRVADLQTSLAGDGGAGTREHMRHSPHTAMPDRFNQPKRTMGQVIANHERANPAGRWA